MIAGVAAFIVVGGALYYFNNRKGGTNLEQVSPAKTKGADDPDSVLEDAMKSASP